MIKSFKDKNTRKIWSGIFAKAIPASISGLALVKLRMLNNAVMLDNLKIPPGNRLEALKGNRSGQYSIRINDQFRICFVWEDGHAHDVEIVDYH